MKVRVWSVFPTAEQPVGVTSAATRTWTHISLPTANCVRWSTQPSLKHRIWRLKLGLWGGGRERFLLHHPGTPGFYSFLGGVEIVMHHWHNLHWIFWRPLGKRFDKLLLGLFVVMSGESPKETCKSHSWLQRNGGYNTGEEGNTSKQRQRARERDEKTRELWNWVVERDRKVNRPKGSLWKESRRKSV